MIAGFEEKQTCPFCDAKWGTCDHFDVLAEWEADAAKHEMILAEEKTVAQSESEHQAHHNHIEGK